MQKRRDGRTEAKGENMEVEGKRWKKGLKRVECKEARNGAIKCVREKRSV